MNKKLVAVAIAGLLAAPLAQAQTANVTMYGRLNMDMEVVNGKQLAATQPTTCTPTINAVNTCNTTNPNQFRVSSNSSRFGLRGTESLGGGLNAIFQIENAISADNAGNQAATNRVLGNRDTYVGLQGSWGKVYAGFYHLPYDNIGTIWGDNPTLETSILNQGVWAQSFASKGTGSFDDRVGNSIRWDSPVISGWQAQLSYSIGGAVPANGFAPNEAGAPQTNSAVSSGILLYSNGPILFGAGFQYNNAVRARGLNDIAYTVAGSYQFPKFRLGVIYERLDYDCATGTAFATVCQTAATSGTTSLTRNFYGVDATLDVGPGQAYFRWSFAGEGGGSVVDGARIAGLAKGDNSSSNQYQLSYAYPLSKRTSLYAGYAGVLNKSNASYNFGVNSYGTAIGGKPQGLAAGMWHNF
jgi:predicted porin